MLKLLFVVNGCAVPLILLRSEPLGIPTDAVPRIVALMVRADEKPTDMSSRIYFRFGIVSDSLN